MTDKYIGKPVLEHYYCEHEYKTLKAKRCIKKVPKVKKQKKVCSRQGLNPGDGDLLRELDSKIKKVCSRWGLNPGW